MRGLARACILSIVALSVIDGATAADPIRPFDYISLETDDLTGTQTSFDGRTMDPDHSLVLNWDEEALRATLAGSNREATLSMSEETELIALRELVSGFLDAQAALVRAKTLGASTRSEEARLAQNQFSQSGSRVLILAKAHKDALDRAGMTAEAAAFKAALDTLVLAASYQPLAEAMRAQITQLNTRVARTLADAPKREVRMRASLVGELASRRLHLDGYDEGQTFDPVETPRFQVELDDRGRAEVENAQSLQKTVEQAISGELQQKIVDAVEELGNELVALGEAIEKDVLEATVRDAMAEMKASGDDRFDPSIEAGRRLLTTLESLTFSGPPFAGDTSADQLLLMYDALADRISRVIAVLNGLESQLRGFVEDLQSTAADAPGLVADRTIQQLQETLQSVQGNPRIKEVLEVYETIRASLGLSLDVSKAALDVPEIPRGLDDFLDTRLDLLVSTPGRRHHGDVVILEAVISEDTGETTRVIGRGFRKIRLMQRGLRGEVRGALILSDPRDRKIADQNWEPSPALAYMLHLAFASSRFWDDVLDPGLGISMSLLDYRDQEGFELGVAVNASLFRSLLWAGYGRNIQAEADYFYIGVNPLVIGQLFRQGSSGGTAMGLGSQ